MSLSFPDQIGLTALLGAVIGTFSTTPEAEALLSFVSFNLFF